MMRRRLWGATLAAGVAGLVAAQEPRTAIDYNRLAVEAFRKQDRAAYLEHSRKAHELWPNNPRLMFHMARAHALAGNRADALHWLDRASQIGHVDAGDTAFAPLRHTPQMAVIQRRVEEWKKPRGSSVEAFRLAERDLIPENVAWDPATRTFFVGAIYKRKIVARDIAGNVRDFVVSKQDGLGGVLGMRVDSKRRRLWAVSANGPNTPVLDAAPEEPLQGIFVFHLDTGKLVRKITSFADGQRIESANDVVLDSQGNAYLSFCQPATVCRVAADATKAEAFVPSGALVSVNGIAISDDDRYLFVAHGNGVERVDLRTRARFTLPHPPGMSLSGIDGLYFYKRSLVAVQNRVPPERVARFYLSGDLSRVERAEILEVNNPHFAGPTSGCIASGTLYYIPDSNLRAFEDGKLLAWERLVEPVILQIRLKD